MAIQQAHKLYMESTHRCAVRCGAVDSFISDDHNTHANANAILACSLFVYTDQWRMGGGTRDAHLPQSLSSFFFIFTQFSAKYAK